MKTRKMLTMYKMHHLKADVDRLYVRRKGGGRGLMQVEAAYKAEIINTADYLNTNYKNDQFINIVQQHESTQPTMNSVIWLVAKIKEELGLLQDQRDAKQEDNQHMKAKLAEVLKKKQENKVMQGQYLTVINRQLIHEEYTFL